MVFGVAPALQATAAAPSRGAERRCADRAGSRSRLLPSLVSAQVALSLVLLVGAGLFVRTLQNLQRLRSGVRARGRAARGSRRDERRRARELARRGPAPARRRVRQRVDAHAAERIDMERAGRAGGPAAAGARHRVLRRRRPGLLRDDADSAAGRARVHGPRLGGRAGRGDRQRTLRRSGTFPIRIRSASISRPRSAGDARALEIVGVVGNTQRRRLARGAAADGLRGLRAAAAATGRRRSEFRAAGRSARWRRHVRRCSSEAARRAARGPAALRAGRGDDGAGADDGDARRRVRAARARCSRASASTACSPTAWPSAPRRSAFGWPWARSAAQVVALVLKGATGWSSSASPSACRRRGRRRAGSNRCCSA